MGWNSSPRLSQASCSVALVSESKLAAVPNFAGISAEDLAEQEEQDLERLQSEVAAQAEAPDPADADEDAQG